MYYREFLRVRRVFIGFAIGLLCIAMLVVVFAGHVHGSVNLAQAPAGHAVVAAAAATDNSSNPNVGVQIEGNSDKAPVEVLFGLAGFIAAIFALVLGCALATENNGHLEIAWTRPVSRSGYALRLVLVDAIGILAMFAFVLVLSGLVIGIEGWWPHLHSEPATIPLAARLFAFPFAWYGLVCALTASLRGGSGLVAGLAWPVASIAIVLQKVLEPHAPVLSKILAAIDLINPMLYTSFSDTESTAGSAISALVHGQAAAIAGLSCIAVGGVAVALLQWRRLEA